MQYREELINVANSFWETKRSNKEDILKFYDVLKKNNINVTIRREFGSKINAACGQLKTVKENLA